MKKAFLIALALLAAPIDPVAAFTSATFPASGTISGYEYVAITANSDNYTFTYHLKNGGVFTTTPIEPGRFLEFVMRLAASTVGTD